MKVSSAINHQMVDACMAWGTGAGQRLQSETGLSDEQLEERDCNKLLADGSEVVQLGCLAVLSQQEYCPGGSIGWYDQEHPCSITRCPPGLQRLAADTDGHIDGCYKCPVGTIDVKETVAAAGSTEFGMSVQMGRGVLQTVLCKEGPHPTAKPPRHRLR